VSDAQEALAPGWPRAYLQASVARATEGRAPGFELALKVYPESAPARAAFGRFLLRRHDYPRAVELFEAAIKTDKKEIDYLDGYVRALLGAGKQVQANKAVTDAVANFPGNPRISFLQGRVADELDTGLDAESNYKRASDADKTLWEPAYYLGRYYLARKRVDEAKKWCPSPRAGPNIPDTHVGEGNARLYAGELPAAKAQFLAALKLDPESAGGHFGLAQVLVLEGSLEDARKEFEAVLAIDPRLPKLHTAYGRLLWSLKDFEAASKALEKAKEADPRDSLATWSLGAVLYEWSKVPEAQNRFADALKNLDAALTIEPIADAYFYKAKVHYDRRENNQSIDAIKAALERGSLNPQYHNLRGHIMYQSGKFQEAVDAWQTAVKIKPDYADAIEALARNQGRATGTCDRVVREGHRVDPPARACSSTSAKPAQPEQRLRQDHQKYEEASRDPKQAALLQDRPCYDSRQDREGHPQLQVAIKNDPRPRRPGVLATPTGAEPQGRGLQRLPEVLEVSRDAGDRKEIENEVSTRLRGARQEGGRRRRVSRRGWAERGEEARGGGEAAPTRSRGARALSARPPVRSRGRRTGRRRRREQSRRPRRRRRRPRPRRTGRRGRGPGPARPPGCGGARRGSSSATSTEQARGRKGQLQHQPHRGGGAHRRQAGDEAGAQRGAGAWESLARSGGADRAWRSGPAFGRGRLRGGCSARTASAARRQPAQEARCACSSGSLPRPGRTGVRRSPRSGGGHGLSSWLLLGEQHLELPHRVVEGHLGVVLGDAQRLGDLGEGQLGVDAQRHDLALAQRSRASAERRRERFPFLQALGPGEEGAATSRGRRRQLRRSRRWFLHRFAATRNTKARNGWWAAGGGVVEHAQEGALGQVLGLVRVVGVAQGRR
jgi:tetratricopeptide (TPR) repeat protein